MNLQELYVASLRQDEIKNRVAQEHHPHPQQVEIKPSLWQRISNRSQDNQGTRTARIRPA